MSIERPDLHPQEPMRHEIRVTTSLGSEFLNERPGWLTHYTRKIAAQALAVMEASDGLAFEALTVTSEVNENAVEHGGQLSEFDLVHFPAEDGTTPETVYVVAINPTRHESATPGTARRGALAASGTNATAESGRGLLMTDVYTSHNWGQRNVVNPGGDREVVTFAVLSRAEDTVSYGDAHHDQAA